MQIPLSVCVFLSIYSKILPIFVTPNISMMPKICTVSLNVLNKKIPFM